MTWVKISDTFADDPRLEDAGADAFAVHVAGLCFCSRQLTDGHVPRRSALRLWSVDDPVKAVSELVRVGLWTETDAGYQIADYLEDQPSADEVRQKRAEKAERMRRWREKKKGVDAPRDKTQDASRDASPPPTRPAPKGGKGGGRSGGSASAAPLRAPVEPTPFTVTDKTSTGTAKICENCGAVGHIRCDRKVARR